MNKEKQNNVPLLELSAKTMLLYAYIASMLQIRCKATEEDIRCSGSHTHTTGDDARCAGKTEAKKSVRIKNQQQETSNTKRRGHKEKFNIYSGVSGCLPKSTTTTFFVLCSIVGVSVSYGW